MKLSRKWLQEFVETGPVGDREFAEAMTISGSKVEVTEDLGAEIDKVVVGCIEKMERHPDSDHMWICQVDAGGEKPVQIVTGAWNIHEGDLVPVALDGARLPGGKEIHSGKLRGVLSGGMMCSLKELNLDERDFPYGVITAAALLNDYKPIDPEKPSIPADIQPGDKIFGRVVAAKVCGIDPGADGQWLCNLTWTKEDGPDFIIIQTPCQNIHVGDMVAGVSPLHPRRHFRPAGRLRTRRRYQAYHRRGRPCSGIRDHPQPARLPQRHRSGAGGDGDL